jgi:microcystin-dependent protein
MPTGVVIPWAGVSTTAPTGWLLCSGQAVSRTTFLTLFNAVNTVYGAGDGSTTFNVPDLRGRVVAGLDNIGGSAASRLTATTMSPNGTTTGATGGAQTETASVSGSFSGTGTGSASVNGSTTIVSNGAIAQAPNGPDFTAARNDHIHNISFDAPVGVSVSGSISGTSAAATNVQPTMIMNYIIKT